MNWVALTIHWIPTVALVDTWTHCLSQTAHSLTWLDRQTADRTNGSSQQIQGTSKLRLPMSVSSNLGQLPPLPVPSAFPPRWQIALGIAHFSELAAFLQLQLESCFSQPPKNGSKLLDVSYHILRKSWCCSPGIAVVSSSSNQLEPSPWEIQMWPELTSSQTEASATSIAVYISQIRLNQTICLFRFYLHNIWSKSTWSIIFYDFISNHFYDFNLWSKKSIVSEFGSWLVWVILHHVCL